MYSLEYGTTAQRSRARASSHCGWMYYRGAVNSAFVGAPCVCAQYTYLTR
jgi:hypothetical protein